MGEAKENWKLWRAITVKKSLLKSCFKSLSLEQNYTFLTKSMSRFIPTVGLVDLWLQPAGSG